MSCLCCLFVDFHIQSLTILLPLTETFDKDEEDDDFDPDASDLEDELEGLAEEAEEDEDLNEAFADLKMVETKKPAAAVKAPTTFQNFLMAAVYPVLAYKYMEDDRNRVTIEFLTPAREKTNFKCSLSSNGKELHLSTLVPRHFTSQARVMQVNGGENFNQNTHKATAFKEDVVKKVNAKFGQQDPIWSQPQVVPLPWPGEDDSIRVVQELFPDEEMSDRFFQQLEDNEQWISVLAVTVIKVETVVRQREDAVVRTFRSPNGRRRRRRGADDETVYEDSSGGGDDDLAGMQI